MTDKITRQGVTDLGGNDQLAVRRKCQHFYTATEPVGRDLVRDDDGLMYYETVYGKRCVHCGDVRVIL